MNSYHFHLLFCHFDAHYEFTLQKTINSSNFLSYKYDVLSIYKRLRFYHNIHPARQAFLLLLPAIPTPSHCGHPIFDISLVELEQSINSTANVTAEKKFIVPHERIPFQYRYLLGKPETNNADGPSKRKGNVTASSPLKTSYLL
jgi:hypothetical protein